MARPQGEWARAIAARLRLVGTETVIDAGCGTGILAELVAPSLPEGTIICIDSSREMLLCARDRLDDVPGTRILFVRDDLATLDLAERADVIVSNAAFHWIKDQERLFRSLYGGLKPGGRLLAQCGGAHNLATEVARLHPKTVRGIHLRSVAEDHP